MRRYFKYGFLLLLVGWLLRGALYRLAINYRTVDSRPTVTLLDRELQASIDASVGDQSLELGQIVTIATYWTEASLRFTWQKAPHDPNRALATGRANCIGYAALFQSIVDYLLERHGLTDRYAGEHLVAHLECFGIDIHPWLRNPFLRDHDFNRIRDLRTGETIAVDPSLSDYFSIDRVRAE